MRTSGRGCTNIAQMIAFLQWLSSDHKVGTYYLEVSNECSPIDSHPDRRSRKGHFTKDSELSNQGFRRS
ncbi:hypothetical protein MESS2_1010002 [Mesorhizobium metallidurans STM 2683]|uniref:Uncharacterized protein n=2 Tax=Mesorhizobium TaxID=68287 RepID=A0A2P9AMS3_9HYPH|nr:hypothetical protein MESS2_1010002 [Mesorhizobium metallidurans STM 2683]SJM32455.1 conserved hypothetical protein [Mesorhizobium delmotii]